MLTPPQAPILVSQMEWVEAVRNWFTDERQIASSWGRWKRKTPVSEFNLLSILFRGIGNHIADL